MSEVGFPDPSTSLEIDPESVAQLQQASEKFVLVDCREQDEYDFCRIEGGRLIPLSQFAELATVSLTELNEPIVVYCHHGMRSLQATQFLRAKGFKTVFSMRGGIEAWSEEVDPNVPRY
ncbi:MAG: rhodanese-like domain-containing protein [Verrucomicrobiota bacterium]